MVRVKGLTHCPNQAASASVSSCAHLVVPAGEHSSQSMAYRSWMSLQVCGGRRHRLRRRLSRSVSAPSFMRLIAAISLTWSSMCWNIVTDCRTS